MDYSLFFRHSNRNVYFFIIDILFYGGKEKEENQVISMSLLQKKVY